VKLVVVIFKAAKIEDRKNEYKLNNTTFNVQWT